MVTVFIPDYVVMRWWEQVLHNQIAVAVPARSHGHQRPYQAPLRRPRHRGDHLTTSLDQTGLVKIQLLRVWIAFGAQPAFAVRRRRQYVNDSPSGAGSEQQSGLVPGSRRAARWP